MPIDKVLFRDFNVKNNIKKYQNEKINPKEENNKSKDINNNLLYGSLLAIGAIAFAGIVIHNKIKNKSSLKEIIYDAEKTLNYDKEYRAKLIKGLEEIFGIKKEAKDLKSVMGKEEFQNIISTYSPENFVFHMDSIEFMRKIQKQRYIKNDWTGKIDDSIFYKNDFETYKNYILKGNNISEKLKEEYYKPLIEGKYRVCFVSNLDKKINDSHLAAETFLNQSAQYANKVAKKSNDGKPPFIIFLNEKIEVQKEVLKILTENPEKYKNVKIIFNYADGNVGCNSFVNPLIKETDKIEKNYKKILEDAIRFRVPKQKEYEGLFDSNERILPIIRTMKPIEIASWMKDNFSKAIYRGDRDKNPFVNIDEYAKWFPGNTSFENINEIVVKSISPKGSNVIIFPMEDMYYGNTKTPIKYIIGDDIEITDSFWKKIIS